MKAASRMVLPVSLKKPVRAPVPTPAPTRVDPLQRNRRIDDMVGDELRLYARQLGITQRDADGLSEDRLRQNCKVKLFDLIDSL